MTAKTKNMSPSETVEISKAEEIEMLRRKLAELEKEDYSNSKIQQDEYISVMSLIPYTLNLTTQTGGQGSVKKFTKFGEIKKIIYKDLVDIMEAHPNFLEAGYFYILDPRFIRQHGLDETYSRILTKEKIDEILSTGSEESVTLYDSANPEQKGIIRDLLVEKIVNDPDSVDLNIVDRISRISKVDLRQRAENVIKPEKVE